MHPADNTKSSQPDSQGACSVSCAVRRGKFQWMNRATGPWTSPLPPAVVDPVITMYTKFEMEGNFQPQPFIAYGALFAAPARDDSLCSSRRDYTYAVSPALLFPSCCCSQLAMKSNDDLRDQHAKTHTCPSRHAHKRYRSTCSVGL